MAAGKTPAGSYDSSQPINITSDRLEADDAARQVKFLGNVVARQGEVVIYSAVLTLIYSEGSKDIDRVEADRDVRIVQGDRVATAEKAVFYQADGRIVLTGNARVHQGADFVEGDVITVFLGEEKSVVQGREGSRVNAIFHPKEEKP
ncbi:MAG TPA: lipopolysaccharide transport periplasmic protein LptA [Desulfuromonadales bacterium]|nr:lipopolysaccharide transport periplasmic protein LptA [Desulfuromonadales bacterium]